MAHAFARIAFTDTVKAIQAEQGSRASYARFERGTEPVNEVLGPTEAGFIAARDSFYMATVGETGWPYVQHRGGPPGFVRVLDERTLGFADLRGNRQYITVGNLATDDRVSLFFMDYANRTRLKLLGRARIVGTEDQATLSRLMVPEHGAKVERAMLIEVVGFDWNCPQHITPRFTLEEVKAAVAPLQARIAELEARLGEGGGGDPVPGRIGG